MLLKRRRLWVLFLACCLFLPGCKTSDLYVWNRGPSFESDLKMKIAVQPFEDSARVSGGDRDDKVARLLAERLDEYDEIVVVPWTRVASYMEERRIPYPLTNNTASLVGRQLGLNAVVMGQISEMSQLQKQTGVLSFVKFPIPYLSETNEVLTAVLVARAVDVSSGVILGADVGKGETKTGMTEEDLLMGRPAGGVDQKIQKASTDEAIDRLAVQLAKALGKSSWKGFIVDASKGNAVMSSGQDVGIRTGDRFEVYSTEEKVTNRAGQTYVIPGPIKAELEAVSVSQSRTDLRVVKGEVHKGDTAQATN